MGRQVALLVITHLKSHPLKTASRGGPPLPPLLIRHYINATNKSNYMIYAYPDAVKFAFSLTVGYSMLPTLNATVT